MDLATVLGLIIGFGLVGAAIVMGGSPTAFLDGSAILIVFAGTFSVTMMSYSLAEIVAAQTTVVKTMIHRATDPAVAASQVMELADYARREGLLSLQNILPEIKSLPFLHDGIAMIIDGASADDAEYFLRRNIESMRQRHSQSAGVLRRAAEVAPAMGLIGTLVGLVQMLGNLEDPSTVGPSMAVALLTTFYGAVLGNMVFTPLAGKLERNSHAEVMLQSIYLSGIASIGRQENPRRLEMVVNTLLPPSQRIDHFD